MSVRDTTDLSVSLERESPLVSETLLIFQYLSLERASIVQQSPFLCRVERERESPLVSETLFGDRRERERRIL